MKKLSIITLVLMLFLAACTSFIYGVPQETWDRMSESERIEVMRGYEREQQARRLAAEERARRQAAEDRARRQAEEEQARRQAFEREREREHQARLARARQERIEAIHRGEGAYGELLRVRLQGGRIRVHDRHYRYEPITFTIADDETLEIGVAERRGRGREAALIVTYSGGALSLEGRRFLYDRGWGRGRLYPDTSTSGPLELRGVDVFIEAHNRSSRHERELPRLVIIREEPPPPVIVREERPIPPPLRHPEPPVADRPPRILEIVLLSGEMKVRGRNQNIERATLRLAEGESRSLAVKAGNSAGDLTLTYRNGELSVDDSPGRGRDEVRLPFEKEWRTGKVYRFELKGKMHLEKVEMKVTGIEGR